MNLTLAKTYPINAISIQNVESVSENLVLLNFELRSDKLHWDARPYHWLYDFGDFPPLDVSFDSETGLLKEMTIFINKQQLQQQHSYPLTVLSNIEDIQHLIQPLLATTPIIMTSWLISLYRLQIRV